MIPSLRHYIRTHSLFRPGDRVGVAVSGGADSVALLRGLLELREELGIVLSVVHLHHGIRGAEADADEHFVAELARSFDLPLHGRRVDTPAHRESQKLSLEAAARDLRYEFFRDLLAGGDCDKIATAHTLDDQAETVLLRILRGTGTRGLMAIPPVRHATPELAARIVRPLLGARREDIESYLRSLGQKWREDASNGDAKHLRNRIRHELLPQLEREYNPALRQALANLAEIARAEEEHWSGQLAMLPTDGNKLNRKEFLALSTALQRRLLRQVADRIDLSAHFYDIETMRHLAQSSRAEHTFEGGWLLRSTPQHLEFVRDGRTASPEPYDAPLSVPGEAQVADGVRITTTLVFADEAKRYNPFALLAQERLTLPLRIRNWQPGDRFWPAASKQPEKLKRLFQERHIPAARRASWPVVLSGETIVWVRGFPVATGFDAAPGQQAVRIEAIETRQT